ncbi:MAG TPA: ATP-dependent helicase [Armatimonadota bacterium]
MSSDADQFERVAGVVCRKPAGMSAVDCRNSFGQRRAFCCGSDSCRIKEKTDEQLDYVTSPSDRHMILRACPGSGKTEVVGLKAAYEIARWQSQNSGLAVLTFTNSAADVIRRRIMEFVGADRLGYPHYVGTIDSWLHGYLANPFAHHVTGYEGKDGDRRIRLAADTDPNGWLNAFKCDTPYYVLGENGAVPISGIDATMIACQLDKGCFRILKPGSRANSYISDEDYYNSAGFEESRRMRNATWQTLEKLRKDLQETKERFWRKGFATYRDIEYLCCRLLSDDSDLCRRLAARFPVIIVDECQDLSEAQLRILDKFAESGCTLHFVGDMDQAIYAFREVDPQKVEEFAERNAFDKLELTSNFRSSQEVVDLCRNLIAHGEVCGRPSSTPGPACVCFTYARGGEPALVTRFAEYLHTYGLGTEDAAILARGTLLVHRLRPGAMSQDITPPVRKAARAIQLVEINDDSARDDALQCMGAFVAAYFYREQHADSRRYHCPEAVASPLSWRLSLHRLLRECEQHAEIGNLDLTWSQWAKALKTSLPGMVAANCEGAECDFPASWRAPSGEAGRLVAETLGTIPPPNEWGIRIGTIHSAKGETLDAVLLVSAQRRGQGGHWHEWLDRAGDGGEHTRFAYVASSRPKHLLAWAVPTPPPEDKTRLTGLGFTVIGDGS